MPLVIGRLARTRRTIARLAASYDVLLTPTLADVTPPPDRAPRPDSPV